MALISAISETTVGIPVSNAYTIITEVKILKRPIFSAPTVDGGEPGLVAGHAVEFRTESWVSKEAKDAGATWVASHAYVIPFNYTSNLNLMAYLYNWLKTEVEIFANAQNA